MMRLVLALLLEALLCPLAAFSQAVPVNPYYSRVNTFGVFGAYSNDSSHIIMGTAENRKLLSIGASYDRRIWQGRVVNWQYDAEILPVMLESDPVVEETIVYTQPVSATVSYKSEIPQACHSASGSESINLGGVQYAYTYNVACSRRWTVGEGISPVGFQWNFMPKHSIQPLLIGHGGYMYSTQAIPLPNAGSFNFTFDFGAGVEIFRSKTPRSTRSWRVEYRFHHISNHDTAAENPGIDNQVVQISYLFGR